MERRNVLKLMIAAPLATLLDASREDGCRAVQQDLIRHYLPEPSRSQHINSYLASKKRSRIFSHHSNTIHDVSSKQTR